MDKIRYKQQDREKIAAIFLKKSIPKKLNAFPAETGETEMPEASTSRPDRTEIRLRPPATRADARGTVPSRGSSRSTGTDLEEWPAMRSCETDILVFEARTAEMPLISFECEVLLVQVLPTDPAMDRQRGESAPANRLQTGDILLLDLRRFPSVAPLPGAINIALHKALLREIATCFRSDRVNPLDALAEACGRRLNDATIRDLALRASATLERADLGATVFRNQIGRALAAHLLGTYAAFADGIEPARGGLAPWQLKRAQDRMRASLAESLSIPAVADACGLSPSHFARAFRCSTGVSPHAWLVRQRIARAKDLMHKRDLSLGDIAFSCGFADQSHFTRVFAREERMSPGRWRRSIEPESVTGDRRFVPARRIPNGREP